MSSIATNKVAGIEELVEYLKDKSEIREPGMTGPEVYVEKKKLAEAAVYLEDLLELLGR